MHVAASVVAQMNMEQGCFRHISGLISHRETDIQSKRHSERQGRDGGRVEGWLVCDRQRETVRDGDMERDTVVMTEAG